MGLNLSDHDDAAPASDATKTYPCLGLKRVRGLNRAFHVFLQMEKSSSSCRPFPSSHQPPVYHAMGSCPFAAEFNFVLNHHQAR